jgi:hypothetical protein
VHAQRGLGSVVFVVVFVVVFGGDAAHEDLMVA